jgi:hypothetical protein
LTWMEGEAEFSLDGDAIINTFLSQLLAHWKIPASTLVNS